jgi:hypothetical protein
MLTTWAMNRFKRVSLGAAGFNVIHEAVASPSWKVAQFKLVEKKSLRSSCKVLTFNEYMCPDSFQLVNFDVDEMRAIAAIMLDERTHFKVLRFEGCSFTPAVASILYNITAKSGIENLS